MEEIKGFLNAEGQLTAFPAKRKKKLYALAYLAEKIEPDKRYSEPEINDLLCRWHSFGDHATLRRELFQLGFINREKDCSAYWLQTPRPDPAEILKRYG